MKRNAKKESSKFKKTLKILLILATSLLICIATYGIYLMKKTETAANSAYEELTDRESSALREENVEPLKDNVSILFIGIDDSEKRGQGAENARSDALILATLNIKTKTVKTLSIPRDSYVYIPYVDREDKITHAHAYGGTIATIDSIENLLDIPVDYYVRMNFDAFIDIVDALGGVDVEVPYNLVELNEFDEKIVDLKKGLQELNGSEALALARTRKQDNDIERGKRQQAILKAIAEQAAKPSSILKYDNIIQAVADNTKTNMTFSEMKSLLSYLSDGAPRIDSLYLNGSDDMSTGVYYYKLDEESVDETKYTLKNHLGISSASSSGSTSDISADDEESQALSESR